MPTHGEIIRGEITCSREQCKKSFTWLYQYKQRGNSGAYIMPKAKETESIVSNYDERSKQAKVYCPHRDCGQPNFFELNF